AQDVATAMKITAQDLKQLGIIDKIIGEPVGGAHRGHQEVMEATAEAIRSDLKDLAGMGANELRTQRRNKFLAIGRTLGQ
ncbi:MAG: acetyl-CoA carboxylase carboxyltransferase subunit alpha, partial [Rhizobiaceae bacterium]